MATQPQDIAFPSFEITINGSALATGRSVQIQRICVDEEVGLPGMFTLELPAGEFPDNETAWIDDDTFAIGAAVEIKMGYGDTLETLINAEITGLEPMFSRNSPPKLLVRGYDRRHRLMRGRKTRSFLQQKDSDIASAIAQEAGLTAEVVDSQVEHEYMLQANKTDLEFLQERARQIQYEIVVEGESLHFRPVQNDQGETLSLSNFRDLVEFYPRLSTMGFASSLELRGWNPQEKAEIVATAGSGDEVSLMGGGDSGASLTENAFSASTVLNSDTPVFSQAEADQIAVAQFNRAMLRLITGEGVCYGRAELRPGQVIKLEDIGTKFSGNYYVISTRHSISADSGYETSFVVQRNAS